LDPDTRERLFGGISDLIEGEYGGRIVKGYLTTLYLAYRSSSPPRYGGGPPLRAYFITSDHR
jgi:hypothetical protein